KNIKKDSPKFNKAELKNRIFSEIENINPEKSKGNSVISLFRASSIAAIILLIVGIYMLINNSVMLQNTFQSNGDISIVNLEDNSNIVLGTNSSLQKGTDFNNVERNVILEGSAYFNVNHIDNKPFIINFKTTKITVLGTSFEVGTDRNSHVYVKVDEGIVKFENDNGKSVIILKGQAKEFNEIANEFIDLNIEDFKVDLKSKYLSFQNSKITEVLDKLSKFYGVKFQINCDEINGLKGFTSPLNSSFSINDYISTIEKLYNIKFEEIKKNVFVISCN
ncbi:MAG: FecR family protein, partial [Saprospiraceae bacterium]